MANKLYTSEEAIKKFVKDGDFCVISGFGGATVAIETLKVLHEMYLETGHPRNLSAMCGVNIGLDFFAEEGMIDTSIVGHYGPNRKMVELVSNNKCKSYNIPQGLIGHLLRAVTNRETALVSKIGLNTCMDPRQEGATMNDITENNLVELVDVCGDEYLAYKCPQVDVTFLRGTTADEDGNVSLDGENVVSYAKVAAMAAKACGGKVIVEVRDYVKAGSIPAKSVDIPGIFVDAIVKQVDPIKNYSMSPNFAYRPEMLGLYKIPEPVEPPLPLNDRKLIARRSAMELVPNAVVNLGVGIPEMVCLVAKEEGCVNDVKMTLETGFIGGFGLPGERLDIHANHDALFDEPTIFDFYHSGGLNLACLGFAEIDPMGNVNVSKFGGKVCGCGGFVDIAQSAQAVVFCGTFKAGGLRETIGDGKLTITQEGRAIKFKEKIDAITFSSAQALKDGVRVMYITERAVFELREQGLTLVEIAPGIDLEADVIGQMGFRPQIADDLKIMDERLFSEGSIGLKDALDAKRD